MKRWLATLVGAYLLLLTGCDQPGFSVDTLLLPPTLMEEQKQIQEVLQQQADTGETVRLVYPNSEEDHSPYLFCQLDQDAENEVVALYQITDATGMTGSVQLAVLDATTDQTHQLIYQETLPNASDIERMALVQQGDRIFLVLGVLLFSTEDGNSQQVLVYEPTGGVFHLQFSEEVAAYTICDLEQDGMAELVTVVKHVVDKEEQAQTTATRYHFDSLQVASSETVALDPQVTAYQITIGTAYNDQLAIFLDGTKGNALVTEVLQLQQGMLKSVVDSAKTVRPTGVLSTDFDGDGVMEIPVSHATVDQVDQQGYLGWYQLTETAWRLDAETYTNRMAGYYLKLPTGYGDDVYQKANTQGDGVTFYRISDDKALFSIEILLSDNYENRSFPSGYQFLAQDGQLLYVSRILEDQGNDTMTQQQIKDAFYLL